MLRINQWQQWYSLSGPAHLGNARATRQHHVKHAADVGKRLTLGDNIPGIFKLADGEPENGSNIIYLGGSR
jgi:hypothetical protein